MFIEDVTWNCPECGKKNHIPSSPVFGEGELEEHPICENCLSGRFQVKIAVSVHATSTTTVGGRH